MTSSVDDLSGRYFDAAIERLRQVRDEESGAVRAAGSMLADAVESGGRLWAYGAGHSALPAQDLVYRAGGLALVNLLTVPGAAADVVPATLGSALERVEGLASVVLRTNGIRAGDVVIVISLSGRQTLPVEMARGARDLGAKVIGVTSVRYAAHTAPAHASGTFLKDNCDLVIDNKIPLGDAELDLPDIAPAPFAPASTVVISAILQAVTAEASGALSARGIRPPVLRSGNVDGGLEWNDQVFTEYADRIFYVR
ncbi:SIS domain-containing protein [Streptomyces sp. NPDC051940]|uniref:SIS domain-containing protein n=1 Tax=Streptomyces sp. NPDC051940 TaxID=3155675 RepID=UPI00342E12A7